MQDRIREFTWSNFVMVKRGLHLMFKLVASLYNITSRLKIKVLNGARNPISTSSPLISAGYAHNISVFS